jgi:hypothetical protein
VDNVGGDGVDGASKIPFPQERWNHRNMILSGDFGLVEGYRTEYCQKTANESSLHPFGKKFKGPNATAHMAKSHFEYVKSFELPDSVLPETYLVVRIDGRGFHK